MKDTLKIVSIDVQGEKPKDGKYVPVKVVAECICCKTEFLTRFEANVVDYDGFASDNKELAEKMFRSRTEGRCWDCVNVVSPSLT